MQIKNNLVKRLFILILIIFFIPLIINAALYLYVCAKYRIEMFEKDNIIRTNFSTENYIKNTEFREVSGAEKKGKGITLFGCGITYGYNELANYYAKKLSEICNCPVYNRGKGGHYIQHSILQVQSGDIDDIIKNSKYAIYFNPGDADYIRLQVYPGDYFDLNFIFSKYLYPKFITDNNNDLILYKSKHPYIEGSLLYRLSERFIKKFKYVNIPKYHKFQEEFFVKHVIKLKNELEKINPDIKLIVICYFSQEEELKYVLNSLKAQDIIVITGRELLPDFDNRLEKRIKEDNANDPGKDDWDIIVTNLKQYIKF